MVSVKYREGKMGMKGPLPSPAAFKAREGRAAFSASISFWEKNRDTEKNSNTRMPVRHWREAGLSITKYTIGRRNGKYERMVSVAGRFPATGK
jgi:hypothetical protein